MIIENDKSKEAIILDHNRIMIEIGNICDYMIEHRYYMNDTTIKEYANKIKEITLASYYITEPDYAKGDKMHE